MQIWVLHTSLWWSLGKGDEVWSRTGFLCSLMISSDPHDPRVSGVLPYSNPIYVSALIRCPHEIYGWSTIISLPTHSRFPHSTSSFSRLWRNHGSQQQYSLHHEISILERRARISFIPVRLRFCTRSARSFHKPAQGTKPCLLHV